MTANLPESAHTLSVQLLIQARPLSLASSIPMVDLPGLRDSVALAKGRSLTGRADSKTALLLVALCRGSGGNRRRHVLTSPTSRRRGSGASRHRNVGTAQATRQCAAGQAAPPCAGSCTASSLGEIAPTAVAPCEPARWPKPLERELGLDVELVRVVDLALVVVVVVIVVVVVRTPCAPVVAANTSEA